MRQKTTGSFFKVACVTFGVAFVLYLVAGLSGYLRFGATVSGNVLRSFPGGPGHTPDKLMGVVSACFLFVAVFTIPMMNFPIRVSLVSEPMSPSTVPPSPPPHPHPRPHTRTYAHIIKPTPAPPGTHTHT